MKKVLLILFAVCLSSVTWAYEFSDDSTGTTFYYNFGVGGIEVTWGGESETSGTTAYTGDIVIPEEVTYNGDTYFVTGIGEYAFYNCEGLTNIVISNRVTYVSQYAFSYCSTLTEATIGSSVKTIGVEAFSQCTSLMYITSLSVIPPTCESDVFAGVPSEVAVYVEDGTLTNYYNSNSWNGFTIVTITEPYNDARMEWQGFYYRAVSIEEKTAEVIGNSDLRKNAEYYVGDIVVPSSFTYYGMTFTVIGLGNSAFSECPELTSIVLPETVTYVGVGAFSECSSLKEVDLSNVSSIGETAFGNCSSLESVTLCEELTSIANAAFVGCESLESIHLPESVTTIESEGFAACSSLKDINLGNITSLGESCFDGCALTSIDISKVTTIPALAFSNCYDLEEVIFSDQLTEIGYYAMSNCNLFNQALPESVTTLGSYSLAWCNSLTSVELPNVETIGESAFRYDSALETVSLGDKLTSIGNSAFSSCSKMTSITSLNPTPPECGTDVFNGVDLHLCVLYVNEDDVDVYKVAPVWMDFYNIEGIPAGIEGVSADGAEVTGYYTIDGKMVETPQRGVNIVKYTDGTVKKVLGK